MKLGYVCLVMIFLSVLVQFAQYPTVQAHPKQVQINGPYEITYFSDPQDPIVGSQTSLFVQVRDSSGTQLRVLHFVVEMIPPSGPRVFRHPFSNSTEFSFNQAGNWILLFEIGLTNLADFDTTATFVADVSQAQTSGLLAAFASVLAVAIPKSIERWGHILAVVLWLGMMLHIANTYRLSSGSQAGLANFARTFRNADFVIALAVSLLILTGVLRAFAHGLTTVSSLFESDFGLVLLAKILLASGMIAVGLTNRTYLLARLNSTTAIDATVASGSTVSEARSKALARRIYYLVILEMVLGVSAILFGTVFTQIHTIS